MTKNKVQTPKQPTVSEPKTTMASKNFHATVKEVFEKIKTKTGLDNAKVDEWQKKWLAMPETRTKYEHLKDAPVVVVEEGLAMTNDIIDFVQGEEGGKSEILKKLKELSGEPLRHSLELLKNKWKEIKGQMDKPKTAQLPPETAKVAPALQTKEKGVKKKATKKSAPGKAKGGKK